MMNRFGIIAVLCVLVVAACLLLFGTRHSINIPLPETANKTDAPVSFSTPAIAKNSNSPSPADAQPPSTIHPANTSSVTAPRNIALAVPVTAPEFTNIPPATVLENLRTAFHSYQSMFRENPVGTNPEITQALDGGNRKQAHFLNDEDGLRINARGELIDPWGTPFFFHQLSGTQMEIHSAGPDRVMWTADDLV